MKITVEFDLSTEEGREEYEEFKNMRRNARFWDEIYNEVFRRHIKYGSDADQATTWTEVAAEVGRFMKDLEE